MISSSNPTIHFPDFGVSSAQNGQSATIFALDQEMLEKLVQLRAPKSNSELAKNERAGTEYYSCRYIEGGLAFTFSEVQACATRHHGRGAPFLQDMRGDNPTFDLHQIQNERNAIREANQNGGHADCIECPHLQKKAWEQTNYLIRWIGITHYIHCNLRCKYCWLTYAPHSPYNRPEKMPGQRFSVAGILFDLMKNKQLDPDGIVDWGGGGEPTLIPEFDELFDALAKYSVRQVLHTNAVRLPTSAKTRKLNASKLGITCSIDAGNRESYLKIKGRDRFELVFKNLTVYQELGANINLKYIVQESNSSEDEIDQFLELTKATRIKQVTMDVDHRLSELPESIQVGLRYFREKAFELGLKCKFDGCGAHGIERKLVNQLNQPKEMVSREDAPESGKLAEKSTAEMDKSELNDETSIRKAG